MVIILLLASLNSCTNPWIYMAFSTHTCRELYQRHCGKGNSRMRDATSTHTFDSAAAAAGSESRLKKNTHGTHVTQITDQSQHEMPLLRTQRI